MRFFAAALVVFSCGVMGLLAANSYAQRVRNLRELLSFIQLLESEVQFARTTLPEVIAKVIPHFSGVTKGFLKILHDSLITGQGQDFAIGWGQAVIYLRENGLPDQALGDLQDLGRILGCSDVTEQLKHLQLCSVRLQTALEEAKEEQNKQTKLWRYLGFSAGLLIVLLFI
ncbi:MAG: hypothetical protein GX956_08640 [Firmicutes bacterium]|nr:hypothetical protein [Bacillota bacterium]